MYVVQRGNETLTISLQVSSYADHLDYLANIIPVELLSLLIYGLGLIILLLFSFIGYPDPPRCYRLDD